MCKQPGSSESVQGNSRFRSTHKREIRKAKRGHEATLVDEVKENPKLLYKYIKIKRIVRDRAH